MRPIAARDSLQPQAAVKHSAIEAGAEKAGRNSKDNTELEDRLHVVECYLQDRGIVEADRLTPREAEE